MTDNIIDLEEIQKKFNPGAIGKIVAAIIIIAGILTSYYVVNPEEEAVVIFLGKFDRIEGPGLHFKLPFGLEKNYNVPTQRILTEEFGFRTVRAGVRTQYSSRNYSGESVMLTGDLNIVDVRWIIQYKIVNPQNWLFEVHHQRKNIRDISQSVINQLVGDRTIFDVIGNERINIEEKSRIAMNESFKEYKLGIEVTTVKLQNIVPPKGAVQDAFEDVNKAIQDRERLRNEGQESYNKAIPRARGEAQKIIQEAEGYATEKINRAKGDIARFEAVYQEYRKNPSLTRMRLYYEMFEEVFKNKKNTELIDKNLKNFVPFKSLNKSGSGAKGGTK